MYSRVAEESPRFDQVLALGRKLVDELDLESSTDTLSRWMAHYIAELMDHAKGPLSEELAVAKKRCFDAILELWSHRAELPNGKRPFEDLEPIMRAIESLDPESEALRYFPFEMSTVDEAEENSQTQSLLEVARSIDSVARILIRRQLVDAAVSATEQSREWVALAEKAGADIDDMKVVFRLASGDTGDDTSSDPSKREQDLLKERIDLLEAFINLVSPVVEDLKEKLK